MDKTLDDKIDTILASQGVATIEAQTVRALGGSKEDMERAMNHSFNMAKDDIKNLITQEVAAARLEIYNSATDKFVKDVLMVHGNIQFSEDLSNATVLIRMPKEILIKYGTGELSEGVNKGE